MNDIQLLREKVKKLKVLFVDDEKGIRDGTGTFLRKFFDDVVICEDGAVGFETFKKHNDFDVVITDIIMPNMNGIEMVQEIKKLSQDIFVIYLTASRSVEDLKNNFSDITLQKPLSFDNMTLVMKSLGDRL